MKTYAVDVRVYATVYVQAIDGAQAVDLAQAMYGQYLSLSNGRIPSPVAGIEISTHLTCHGPDDDAEAEEVEQ